MPIAILKDGPGAGQEIPIPFAAPTLTLQMGKRTVEYERASSADAERVTYTAREIIDRVETPTKKTTKRVPRKRVPAVTFTGDNRNGDDAG